MAPPRVIPRAAHSLELRLCDAVVSLFEERRANHNEELEAMTAPGNLEPARRGGPADYRIVVQGALGEHWSERLANMKISGCSSAAGAEQTLLEGRLEDQSQLIGVLNSLHGLQLAIELVEALDSESSPEGQQGNPRTGLEGGTGEGR